MAPITCRSQAGTIMAGCLCLGIVIGSFSSFLVKFIYTGTDPFCFAGAGAGNSSASGPPLPTVP